MSQEKIQSYCAPLIGCQVSSIEKMDYTWFFRFTANNEVATESYWRLISNGRIVISSEDHDQKFGLPRPVNASETALKVIANETVQTSCISDTTGDLFITFSNQKTLQFLQTSSGYESWRLCTSGGETFCDGGGEISHFPR